MLPGGTLPSSWPHCPRDADLKRPCYSDAGCGGEGRGRLSVGKRGRRALGPAPHGEQLTWGPRGLARSLHVVSFPSDETIKLPLLSPTRVSLKRARPPLPCRVQIWEAHPSRRRLSATSTPTSGPSTGHATSSGGGGTLCFGDR